jgi:hypothetical protein
LLEKLGDKLVKNSEISRSTSCYIKSIGISKIIISNDAENIVENNRDLIVTMVKLASIEKSNTIFKDIVNKMEDLKKQGLLDPRDEVFLQNYKLQAIRKNN